MGLVGKWLAIVVHLFPSDWTWVPVSRSRSSDCRAYSFGGGEFDPPCFFRSSSVLLRSALMWSRISRWSSSATACDSFASLAARSLAVIAAIWCCGSCIINCPKWNGQYRSRRAEVNKENYVGRTAVQPRSQRASGEERPHPTSSTSLGEAPSQKARRGWLTALVGLTVSVANFVAALDAHLVFVLQFDRRSLSACDGQLANSALRLRTSLFPHESTPSQFGFVDGLYHRKVLDGYSSVTDAVGSDAGDA
jgi:hypothetical protein